MKADQQQLVIGRELATGGDAAAHKSRDDPKGAHPPMIGRNGTIRALEAAIILIPAACESGGHVWFVKIKLAVAHAWHEQWFLEGESLPPLAYGFSSMSPSRSRSGRTEFVIRSGEPGHLFWASLLLSGLHIHGADDRGPAPQVPHVPAEDREQALSRMGV